MGLHSPFYEKLIQFMKSHAGECRGIAKKFANNHSMEKAAKKYIKYQKACKTMDDRILEKFKMEINSSIPLLKGVYEGHPQMMQCLEKVEVEYENYSLVELGKTIDRMRPLVKQCAENK